MTGETSPPQPGGRAPAPGPLALVQAFLNSHYDLGAEHGAEVWRSPDAYARWLRDQGLLGGAAPVGVGELERALEVRALLRALLAGDDTALGALDVAAEGARVEVRLGSGGPRWVSDGSAASALGVVLASAAEAMRDGTWARLKICPGRACGWAFFDHSRNGSGRWCSMSICGGREKARSHYHRTREAIAG